MKINREDLLMRLDSVQAGLSKREVIEQSSCFVFRDGTVATYNEEVCCRTEVPLHIEGAVAAVPLLEILRKLPEEELDIEIQGSELIVKGKKRRCGITIQKEILLPVDQVEVPEKWRKLHPDFSDAVSLVRQSTCDNNSAFILTCIHIHPDYMEACNNVRLTRYTLETKVKQPFLVKGEHLMHICPLGVVRFSETPSWVHFQDPSGLIISMRRYMDDYVNLDPMIPAKGNKITLPKGLPEAVEKALVFTGENAESNDVTIQLKGGKLIVVGQGISGWYKEMKSISYAGAEMAFTISPKLLTDLSARHSECEITQDKLIVRGSSFVYVTSLGVPTGES